MASSSNGSFRRSNSNSRSFLLCNDPRNADEIFGGGGGGIAEASSLGRDMGNLSFSEHAAEKRKKQNGRGGGGSSGCINVQLTGGGCRVCACEDLDTDTRRRPSSAADADDCLPRRKLGGVEEAGVECFSYGMSERFWKKSARKEKAIQQCPASIVPHAEVSLPDDVLEMILVRLPLTSLVAARCVCKKWRELTTAPQFVRLRSEGPHRTPWLLMFGVTRDGCRAVNAHALDVSLSRWHRIRMDKLKGRFLFSIANAGTEVYVVGGRSGSSPASFDNEIHVVGGHSGSSSSVSIGKGSLKTHKGVMVYSPLTSSWRKIASMRSARYSPVLGVFEMAAGCSILQSRAGKHDRHPFRSRPLRVSDVYEDPHRLSIRRHLRDVLSEGSGSSEFAIEDNKFLAHEVSKRPRLALIAVGGYGCWDEPLESGEIYDPLTDKWVEIAGFPTDFGHACSGAVCGRMFYIYSEADKLVAYHLEKGFWVVIETSRPPPRLRDYPLKLLCCEQRLFMVCVSWCDQDGQINRREKVVRKLFELDFARLKWYEASRHPDAPMDPNAAFVADQEQIYAVEMFRLFGKVLDFVTACQVSDSELKWSRVTRQSAAPEADALSCKLKSMALLHL